MYPSLNGDDISWMTCGFFKGSLKKIPIVLRSGGGGRARSEKNREGLKIRPKKFFQIKVVLI
jgi:hypothetical protein